MSRGRGVGDAPPMRLHRSLVLSIGVIGATAAVPVAAHADSIVFLRGGNVWIANIDGSGARALTTDGAADTETAYKAVSAAKGSGAPMLGYAQNAEIGYLRADGTGKQPLPGDEAPSIATSAEIDPTGRRIAWVQRSFFNNASYLYWRTKNADGSDERVTGNGGVDHATWADAGNRSLTSELHISGTPYPSEDGCAESDFNLVADAPPAAGESTDPTRDFTCVAGTNLFDPAVSPEFGRVVAAVNPSAGDAGAPTRLMVLPLAPGMQQGSYLTPEGINATNPDWSTDASTIVFEGNDKSVWTVPAGGGTPGKVLDDAQDPAWTPFGGGTGGGAPGGGPGGGGGGVAPGGGAPGSAESLSLVLRKGIKLKPSLRNGLVVAGQVASAARLTGKIQIDKATAKRHKLGRKKKTLDKAVTVARQAGPYSLEFKFAKKVRRKLKKAESVSFGLKVKATFADGTTEKTRGKLTLKR